MEIGDKVIDSNGYTGIVTRMCESGSIQVKQNMPWQHDNVWCTYDNERQLTILS